MDVVRGDELHELIERRLIELGTGGRPLGTKAAAQKSGGLVSHETIRKIAQGRHSGRLADDTIEGLSRALDIPPDRIHEAARSVKPGRRWKWPERFDRLPLVDRRRVEDYAARLLELHERAERAERSY